MAGTGIDDLSKYESGTDPFAASELEAISRFRENLSDIPDIPDIAFEHADTMWFLDLDTDVSSPLYLNRDGDE
ncbi:hypothetical protein ACFRMQ_16080 [Kitasatospora sp. NPDC056783]|uniref:hypothetical protein n=1 Tax=Kitasatospora sp. NPDC056783 TaxID=3345943 RepID=UPI0036CEC096